MLINNIYIKPVFSRQTLKVMSVAYNSKNLIFPLIVLKKLFLYDDLDDVIKECTYYGLTCSQDGVHFIKLNFKDDVLTVSNDKIMFHKIYFTLILETTYPSGICK